MQICSPAQDTYKLLTFFYDAICISTPHLYISAYCFVPEESYSSKIFSLLFFNESLIVSGRRKAWPSAQWINATTGSVWCISFSPDNHYVAAGSQDTDIHVWEAKTGRVAMKLKGHVGPVWAVAYSPDGRQLTSGSDDCTVRVWDVKTGTTAGEPMTEHTRPVNSVCYSPDGRFIASRSRDRTVRIWDSNTRAEIRRMNGCSKHGQVIYSPDGRKIACCGKEGVRVWDAESGDLIGKKDQLGHVFCVAYAPNGVYLASSSSDCTVRLWNGETLAKLAILIGHCNDVYSVAYSPDGSELLSASGDTTLIRWSTASGKMIGAPFKAHEARIYSAVHSPNGRFIASGSSDNTIRVWDADSLSESSTTQPAATRAIACSPDGTTFATAGDDAMIHIRDIASGASLRMLTGHIRSVGTIVFSSDGHLLASGSVDCTVRIWNSITGTELHKLVGHRNAVTSIVFTADGKHVISASYDKTVRRWTFGLGDDNGEVLFRQDYWVDCICLSPDGKLLASGGRDKMVRFSNPESGKEVGKRCVPEAGIRALAFSADGKYVASGCEDYTIQIWNVNTRSGVRLLTGHSNWVLSVAFSHDGAQLVSSSGDHTIRQWDVETGAELRKLVGHTQSLWCVSTIDEKRIISGSSDGTVRIWNSDVMQKGYVPEVGQELSSLSITDGWITSPNGELLLWVPPEYRSGLRDICEICVPADAPGHPVRLNWSKLVRAINGQIF